MKIGSMVWVLLFACCESSVIAQNSAVAWGAIKGDRVSFSHNPSAGKETVSVWIAEIPSPDDHGNIPLIRQELKAELSVEEALLSLRVFGVRPVYQDTALGKRVIGFEGTISYRESVMGRYLMVYGQQESPDDASAWAMLASVKDRLPAGSKLIWFAVLPNQIQETIIWKEPLKYWKQLLRAEG